MTDAALREAVVELEVLLLAVVAHAVEARPHLVGRVVGVAGSGEVDVAEAEAGSDTEWFVQADYDEQYEQRSANSP